MKSGQEGKGVNDAHRGQDGCDGGILFLYKAAYID